MSARHLSDDDLEAVRLAAAAAERRTAGEIVVVAARRVDDHDEARYRAATFGALAAALAAGLAHWLGGFWVAAGVLWITLPTVAGAAAGYVAAALVPALARRLIDADALERRVRLRAEAAFLEEEVFATRDRTGILVFLALFEHRAVILADAGIHARVEAGVWDRVVADLVAGLRAGRTAAALVAAVERCGEILERHGVERRPDDVNELADAPRIVER
ncbi:MAG TPA: hypothetical protein VGG06_06600 [Thermoanaerobaculia bacterium]|jgi:putative membrane protein